MNKNESRIQEALDLLQEECAEIIQIISKIRRFGVDSYHPDDPTKRTNLSLLEDEIGDFQALFDYLVDKRYLNFLAIEERTILKQEKLKQYSFLFSGD